MQAAGPYNPNWTQAQKLAYLMKVIALLNVSGVNDKIVACIVTSEEDPSLDPGEVNPSGAGFGAIGLMQIRQISLNDVNRSYNLSVPEYRQSDLYDPNANIFIGTSNLANHIRYANGDVWQGIRTAGDGTDAYVNRIKKCAGQ